MMLKNCLKRLTMVKITSNRQKQKRYWSFIGPKAKTHAYLIGNDSEKKQAKGKMC